ncbi:MAG: hypothetical protein AVDCRST_MAG64-1689 [uncultured Phycisphaerae bacterium]|uniref:Uncharacterized protein n=1 Tax=uncultured Phycisphaerae bacterium TaxID=904963 RepID=A0A6J4NWF8_9BACT|nr:MAG: hypothetical protein AVDCRST_MAG64-1689 [uncultured Phycisphaerae bacterium]
MPRRTPPRGARLRSVRSAQDDDSNCRVGERLTGFKPRPMTIQTARSMSGRRTSSPGG